MTYRPKARLKVRADGEWVAYTHAAWVVFNKQKFPIGFMDVELKHLLLPVSDPDKNHRLASRPKAFRDYWGYVPGVDPMAHALDGYTIELVGPRRRRELLDIHLGSPYQRPVEDIELPEQTPEP